MFTLAFYAMFAILPIRAVTIRGDFFLYTMLGGISVRGACSDRAGDICVRRINLGDDAARANEYHAISAAALSILYTQATAGLVLLFGYYVAITQFEI